MSRLLVRSGGLVAVASLALACARPLDLPAAPVDQGPAIAGFEPNSGVAGTRVIVRGERLHAPARVRFGTRAEVDALFVDAAHGTLTVEVPEDAASGPLTVVVDGREGRSSDSFAFQGVDHLKFGRIAESTDLRVPVVDAWPLAGGKHFVLAGTPYSRVAHEDGDIGRLPIDDSLVVSSDWNPDLRLLVLAEDDRAQTCGDGFGGRVWFVKHPFEPDAPAPRVVCVPRPNPDLGFTIERITLSPDGTRALASAYNGAVLLDVESGNVVGRLENDGSDWIAAALPGRFVLADESHLWSLDAATGVLGEAEESHADDLSALGATSDGRLLAGTRSGKALLYTNEWPPRVAATFDTHHGLSIESIAWSARTSHFAVVQQSLDRVVVFDGSGASPDTTPLAAATFASPRHVTSSGDGVFRVGHAGGFSLLSDTTGAVLETRRVKADLSHVVLHQRLSSGDTALVAAVASPHFSRVFQLMRGETADFALDVVSHGSPAEALAVGGSAQGAPLYVARKGFVHHTAADSGYSERADRFALPAGARIDGDLEVPADGGAVAFVVTDSSSRVAYVLDDAADWSTVTPARITLDDGEGVSHVAFDRSGHLLAWSIQQVRILDAAAARQGTVKDVVPPLTFDLPVRWAGGAGHDVLVATRDDTWWRIDASGKARVAAGPEAKLASPDDRTGLVTPFGRRLYWLYDTFFDARLASVGFDLSTGLPALSAPDVVLPTGTRAVAFLPDGEHAVASDPVEDQLYWLE